MTVGFLEGITSALGDELNTLAGFRITRLTAPFLADDRFLEGVDTASSADAGITVTLSGSDQFTGVTSGMIFRVTSGPEAGKEGTIATVAPTQITLDSPGIGANFSSESWEIIERQTTASVETTIDWETSGVVFIDGSKYTYSAKTPTSLTGMQHFDGVSYKPGAEKDHRVLAEVLDFTRTHSAIDKLRRSFFTRTATDSELNVIGSNLAVPRPPLLDDTEAYRRLIQAIAYAPRGTVYAIELAMNAIFGAGNYEIFEDLTIGSLKHPATVFLYRPGTATSPNGKAFIEGEDVRLMSSSTAVTIGQTPLKIRSVLLEDEPAELVAQGTGASSVNAGLTITGTFSTNIRQGDLFFLTSGGEAGRGGLVKTASAGTLTLEKWPEITANFSNVAWKVHRHRTNARYYLPDDDLRIMHSADTGSAQWAYTGNVTKGTYVTLKTLSDNPQGPYLSMVDPTGAGTCTFQRNTRVRPESYATLDFQFGVGGTISASAGSQKQIAFHLCDGARDIAVGCLSDGGDNLTIGFIHTDVVAFIGSTTTISVTAHEFASFRIVKNADSTVELYKNGNFVSSAAYSSFHTSAAHEIVFGLESTATSGAELHLKEIGWCAQTSTDYWNYRGTGTIANPNQLTDGGTGAFAVSDVDARTVRIKTKGSAAGTTGNARGEWLVASRASATVVTLKGVKRTRARIEAVTPNRIYVDGDPYAFAFPDVVGHKILFNTGPNATVSRTILKVLNPVTFADLRGTLVSWGTDPSGTELTPKDASSVIEVDGAALAADLDIGWELVPQFAASNNVDFELVAPASAVASGTSLTLPTAMPFSFNPVVSVHYTTVQSMQALDEIDQNTETASVYKYRPFYLSDLWSWVRFLVHGITAAGVLADFDSLVRDSKGLHILKE